MNDKTLSWRLIDSFVGNSSSASLTLSRPCPICEALKSRTVCEFTDFQFFSDCVSKPKRVSIKNVVCSDCHALYLNPCYSNYGFNVLFAEAGQSYGSTEGRPLEQIDWLNNRKLLNPNSRLLDVGCYDGAFLSKLPAHVQKLGVDIDEPAIERGRQQHDIQFFLGDFETFEFNGESPSVITMFHVLEHLPRPVQVLRKLRSISKSSTHMVVEVPVLENGKTNDINGFMSVQHMTHFSQTSLRNCLAVAGWRIIEEEPQDDYNGFRVLARVAEDGDFNLHLNAGINDYYLLISYLENWYNVISRVEKRLLDISLDKQLVIWGGGLHTEFLFNFTSLFSRLSGVKMCIVDSDPLKHGRSWRGVNIYPPDILNFIDWDSSTLLISSYGGQDSIKQAALEALVPESVIVTIYETIRRY
jgi:hypothetical protein